MSTVQISRDMVIAGSPAVKLRDAFKWFGGSPWTSGSLADRLGVDESSGSQVAAVLLDEGYIKVEHQRDECTYFTVTVKGGALALATAAKRIKRATADRLISEVIRVATCVNTDRDYFFRVTKLLVFGSYLTDCPTLGDVDLAVELEPWVAGSDRDSDAVLAYANQAEDAGRRFSSMFERLYWPTEEIHRALKGSSKAVSIHRAAEPIIATVATRVLYEHA